MEQIKNTLKEVREKIIEAFTEFPMEMEIPPTPCVIEMNTERDGIEILGRVQIVKISPGGQIWDDEGNVYSIQGGQSPYAIEDMMELHKVVLVAAQKALKDAGFNTEE